MTEFETNIENLKKASPLQLPQKIMEIELHDQETAFDIFDKVSAQFAKEDLMDNIVNPSICTIIDGVLALPCFSGAYRKLGLSAQRVMNECKTFNYDGRISFLMPDSQVEARNNAEDSKRWSTENRSDYVRSEYENTSEMNRYKKERIQANGGRVNMEDEYRLTNDISGTRKGADKRRNDPKYEYVAETDHITPLHTVFSELQENSGLSKGDIREIANQSGNFAVTGRLVNNPKRDMSNTEFIALQDKLKAEGKPFLEFSEEQRANMIQMEIEAQNVINESVNDTILKNLSGCGHADRKEIKSAIKEKETALGRKLTKEESLKIMKKLAINKTEKIYGEVCSQAAQHSLMYAMGNAVLLVIKPLYYELKDGFVNGFVGGVNASSGKEAFKIRFSRIRDYVWKQLTDIQNALGSFMDFLKNFISSLIESLLNMFVGLFKQILRVAKEGIKIVMQSSSILFGENSKNMNANEKGDAIIKIIGGSAVALCGIAIDSYLNGIPENIRGVVSTLLSGLAGIIVFYALDKADLFNVKAERRNARIKEIFDLRIQDLKEKTAIMDEAVNEALRESRIETEKCLNNITEAWKKKDYAEINRATAGLYQFLFEKPVEVRKPGEKWNC